MAEASGFYGTGWLNSNGCVLADLLDPNEDDGVELYVRIQKHADTASNAGALPRSNIAIA